MTRRRRRCRRHMGLRPCCAVGHGLGTLHAHANTGQPRRNAVRNCVLSALGTQRASGLRHRAQRRPIRQCRRWQVHARFCTHTAASRIALHRLPPVELLEVRVAKHVGIHRAMRCHVGPTSTCRSPGSSAIQQRIIPRGARRRGTQRPHRVERPRPPCRHVEFRGGAVSTCPCSCERGAAAAALLVRSACTQRSAAPGSAQ